MSTKNVCLTSKISRKIISVHNIESIDDVLNFKSTSLKKMKNVIYYVLSIIIHILNSIRWTFKNKRKIYKEFKA